MGFEFSHSSFYGIVNGNNVVLQIRLYILKYLSVWAYCSSDISKTYNYDKNMVWFKFAEINRLLPHRDTNI